MDDTDGQQHAEHRADAEAEQSGRKRDPGMIDQAALRGDRLIGGRIPDLGDHLVRSRQHRAFLGHGIAEDFGKADLGAGAGGGIPFERCVQEDRCDVPARDQQEDDGGDGKELVLEEAFLAHKALLTSLDKPIDRLTYTVLLSKALGFQPLDYTGVFTDIEEMNYSKDELGYLMAGVMNGLVFGKESNIPGYMVMEPKNTLTREEAVAFLARAINLNGADQEASKSKFAKKKKSTKEAPVDPKVELKKTYKDANKISDWAAAAVLQATNEKLMTPTSGNFNPKGKLTKAEAMSMIYKLMESKKLK